LILESEPIAPAATVPVFLLVPRQRMPIGEPAIDPATAAAFVILRIDVLTEGETLAEVGFLAKSVRVLVENRAEIPCRFRMEIALAPDYAKLTREVGALFDSEWGRRRDTLKQ
jgi:hypothetical protein